MYCQWIKPIVCKDIDDKSMLCTGCIQCVVNAMSTIKFNLCHCVIKMTSKVILIIDLYMKLFARTDMVLTVQTIIYLHTVLLHILCWLIVFSHVFRSSCILTNYFKQMSVGHWMQHKCTHKYKFEDGWFYRARNPQKYNYQS